MAAKTQSDLSQPPGGRHAFIVDDEPQVRAFVSKAFVGAGFIPHEFSRVPEVEAALTLFKPEVIVLDLSLGGTDAVEMMRSLAASRFAGKILLVSGHDPATLDEVRKIGERRGLAMLPILRKPFRIEELKARLAEVTEPTGVPTGRADLEAALQNNWLELWYQPKIDLKSMGVCGAEALTELAAKDNEPITVIVRTIYDPHPENDRQGLPRVRSAPVLGTVIEHEGYR